MARAIYAFKMYLFQNQFKLSHKERSSLKNICFSFTNVCSSLVSVLVSEVIKAPNYDFLFMHQLINYHDIDPEITKEVATKCLNHLWYIAPETIDLT